MVFKYEFTAPRMMVPFHFVFTSSTLICENDQKEEEEEDK